MSNFRYDIQHYQCWRQIFDSGEQVSTQLNTSVKQFSSRSEAIKPDYIPAGGGGGRDGDGERANVRRLLRSYESKGPRKHAP